MAANSTINADPIYESYYSSNKSSSSSTGITVVGRTKTYNTYEDLLKDRNPGAYAYVKDASGDPSVESGFAYYRYEDGMWMKLFEEESMDLSVGHTHTNMEVLNNFGIKNRRPTFGSDYLVRQQDLEKAIADAMALIADPDNADTGNIPFVLKSDFEKVKNKFKYTFITEETPAFVLEDQTYIVRGTRLMGQLPNGADVPEDIAIRIIVDDIELAEDENRGVIVPYIDDSINGENMFYITGAMDVTFVYDKVNKDWLVIGTMK